MGVVLLKRKLTSFQIIILGFSGVILFGTFLLMLPFSSRSGLATPFSEALFTSTSAVCVTGLIIHDTATYWSAFGQFVILLLIQIGDSTNADFLESLGVRNYDVCIVAIGNNFQSSLETTSLLSELGARFVVSRAATDVQEKFLLRNGANEVVYPEKQLAKWTAIRYSADHVLDYIELDENHAMFEIPIPKDWADHSIGELDIRKKFNINIMGIKKSGKLELSISSDTVLKAGDTMLALGSNRNLQKCFHT